MVKEALQSQMLTSSQIALYVQECENTEFPSCSVPFCPVRYFSVSRASDEMLLAVSSILSVILSTCKHSYFFPGAA